MAGAVKRVSGAGEQGKWTGKQVIAAIEFDDNGVCGYTPEVAAHIERTYGVTVEEFMEAAAEWFLENYPMLPHDN